MVKKELVKHFPTKEFIGINDIFPKEEEDDEHEEGQTEDNSTNRVSAENVDVGQNVIEAQEEETEDISLPM